METAHVLELRQIIIMLAKNNRKHYKMQPMVNKKDPDPQFCYSVKLEAVHVSQHETLRP